MSKLSESIRAAIRGSAPSVRAQFDAPSARDVAECLVRFDSMALHGRAEELAELRALPAPEDLVEEFLIKEGLT